LRSYPLKDPYVPDLSYVIKASEQINEYLHKDLLICFESTTYPGATKDVLLPILKKNQLIIGEDFFLCFSPERVDPGREDWTIENTPKVVGGITENCLAVGAAFYKKVVGFVVPVCNTQTAEMVKILENSFRAVNIAFINEMMIICDQLGIDIWEVISAAETKPFGFMKFLPGPGVGGHCIPIDPSYLSWKLKQNNKESLFIDLAEKINRQMPDYWITQLEQKLNEKNKTFENSSLLILGIAYKKDIEDYRESPSVRLFQILKNKKAKVVFYDPFIPNIFIGDEVYSSVDSLEAALHSCDCALIATNHSRFDQVNFNFYDCVVINCNGPAKVTKPKSIKEKELV